MNFGGKGAGLVPELIYHRQVNEQSTDDVGCLDKLLEVAK